MAAPTATSWTAGATDAGGAWSFTVAPTSFQAGWVVIVQIYQDGTTNGAVTFTGSTNINNLAGSAGWTDIPGPNGDGSWPVGSAATGRQFLKIGRATATQPTISGGNSTSEDLYCRFYAFLTVSAGTTLATVIENGTAGNATNGAASTSPVNNTAVTTLGPDRLALNFIATDDDVQAAELTAMSGATGGTWSYVTPAYGETSGTDATLALTAATIASAGTIDGASDAITATGWGNVGFALIGTTPSTIPRDTETFHDFR